MEPKAPHADCNNCPLKEEPHALGTGPAQADIVIVGEAPGAQEVASGTPFTGRSGQLLNSILQANGIKREDVYVTNATLCRPPGNATPPPQAIKACHRRLIQELKGRNPKKVLALGNTAAKSLLDTRTGITALRTDQSLKVPGLDIPVVATFHPAAAFRTPDYLPSIQRDVKRLNRVTVGFEYTKVTVPTTIDDALEALARQQVTANLHADGVHKQLTLDVEVSIDDQRRWDAKHPEWLCIGISERPGQATVYPQHIVYNEEYRHRLSQMLGDKVNKWGFQNGKFDIQYLWEFAPEARVDEDTMLLHYSTDERKGTHDLEQLAIEVLSAPPYKQDAKKFLPKKGASLRYLPDEVLWQYNGGDADITHRLIEPLTEEMRSDGTGRAYHELLIPGSNALARAEYLGVKVDRGRLGEVGDELRGSLAKLETTLREGFGLQNPRSPRQVAAVLADLGYVVGSTNKETLNGIDHEFTRILLRHRTDSKLLSTYVTGLGRSLIRSRVHPTFLLHGTETGRLSCRRPNLQNIPSGSRIRDLYVSGPDNILLSADYSQIEFRLAAVLSGDEWLSDQFRAGREFHKEVARRFFGDTWTDVEYLRAKAVNFGILYGRQAPSLAAEWGVPISVAQRMVDEFFKQMPDVKRYQKDLEKQIREKGYLESFYGRKRRFWLVTRENWHDIVKEGYNFPLQSTASDFTLNSLIRLEPRLRGRAAPVITVHDSIIFEVKRQYLEEVAFEVKTVMEDTPVDLPTPVELKVGTKWGSLEKYHAA